MQNRCKLLTEHVNVRYAWKNISAYDAEIWWSSYRTYDHLKQGMRGDAPRRTTSRWDQTMVVHTHQDVQYRCPKSSFETTWRTCTNALTKSILNRWRLIWQTWRSSGHFAGWTALTARVFSREKKLKKITALHVTFIDSTQRRTRHQQSSLDIYRK